MGSGGTTFGSKKHFATKKRGTTPPEGTRSVRQHTCSPPLALCAQAHILRKTTPTLSHDNFNQPCLKLQGCGRRTAVSSTQLNALNQVLAGKNNEWTPPPQGRGVESGDPADRRLDPADNQNPPFSANFFYYTNLENQDLLIVFCPVLKGAHPQTTNNQWCLGTATVDCGGRKAGRGWTTRMASGAGSWSDSVGQKDRGCAELLGKRRRTSACRAGTPLGTPALCTLAGGMNTN